MKPRKPPEEKQSVRKVVSFTPPEWKEIARKIKKGESESEYIRSKVSPTKR